MFSDALGVEIRGNAFFSAKAGILWTRSHSRMDGSATEACIVQQDDCGLILGLQFSWWLSGEARRILLFG